MNDDFKNMNGYDTFGLTGVMHVLEIYSRKYLTDTQKQSVSRAYLRGVEEARYVEEEIRTEVFEAKIQRMLKEGQKSKRPA